MIICEEMKEQNQSLNSAIQSRLAEIAQKNEDIADLQQTIQDKDKMLSDEVAKNEEIESSLDSLTKLLNTEKLKTKAIQALFEEESNLSSRTQVSRMAQDTYAIQCVSISFPSPVEMGRFIMMVTMMIIIIII